LIVTETTNEALIKSVVTEPQIWAVELPKTTRTPENFTPNMHDVIWLSVIKDKELLGVVAMIPTGVNDIGVHPMLLPEKREYSWELAPLLAAWFIRSTYDKMVTNIEEEHGYARLYALRSGMKFVGIKNYSEYLYSATRQELIERWKL